MNFNNHSNLEGQHAFLGASKYHWINYGEDKVAEAYRNFLATQKGTVLHAFAAQCIMLNQKLPKSKQTTFDNPYDPFEQFTQWFMFDEEKGYHTTAYLGRIARTSDQLSDEENNKEVERAIDEIIRYDFQNIYRKVTSKSETNEHKEKAS